MNEDVELAAQKAALLLMAVCFGLLFFFFSGV